MHSLIPHPNMPPKSVDAVKVQLSAGAPGELWLEYCVTPREWLFLPEKTAPDRADGLWKTTCFELFIQPAGSSSYREFNFSPSFQWAAYAFSTYREGRSDFPSHDPEIILSLAPEHVFLAVEALPDLPRGPLKIGLAAVIEEKDGTKSYWALGHPEGKPDFHHPDSFLLEMT